MPWVPSGIIFNSINRLQLLLLVISTCSVLLKPTVIVPKSKLTGEMPMSPSLPAPQMLNSLLILTTPPSEPGADAPPYRERPDPGL